MLRIDPFEIVSVVNGTLRLDGGAMFGVVPKVLWAGATDVDDQNRILLATRTLIAVDRGAGRVILVDTGCGAKWAPHQAERFAITSDAGARRMGSRLCPQTSSACRATSRSWLSR